MCVIPDKGIKENGDRPFSMEATVSGHKWKYKKLHLNMKDVFTVRVVKSWNKNREHVESQGYFE